MNLLQSIGRNSGNFEALCACASHTLQYRALSMWFVDSLLKLFECCWSATQHLRHSVMQPPFIFHYMMFHAACKWRSDVVTRPLTTIPLKVFRLVVVVHIHGLLIYWTRCSLQLAQGRSPSFRHQATYWVSQYDCVIYLMECGRSSMKILLETYLQWTSGPLRFLSQGSFGNSSGHMFDSITKWAIYFALFLCDDIIRGLRFL